MKKFLRYIFTIALFGAMCFGGYKYITDWGKPEPVDIPALEALVEIDESNYLGTYHSEYDSDCNDQVSEIEPCVHKLFIDAANNGAEYVVTRGTSSDTWDAYVITSEQADAFINLANAKVDWGDSGLGDSRTVFTDIATTKEYIDELMRGFEKDYSAYADGILYSALFSDCYIFEPFGDTLFVDSESNFGGLLSKKLKENGLILDVGNVNTRTIYYNESKLMGIFRFYALVDVELTTVENTGIYTDLFWLPNEGDTKTVSFIISLESIYVPKFESHRSLSLECISLFE